jgi:hypothetical protein
MPAEHIGQLLLPLACKQAPTFWNPAIFLYTTNILLSQVQQDINSVCPNQQSILYSAWTQAGASPPVLWRLRTSYAGGRAPWGSPPGSCRSAQTGAWSEPSRSNQILQSVKRPSRGTLSSSCRCLTMSGTGTGGQRGSHSYQGSRLQCAAAWHADTVASEGGYDCVWQLPTQMAVPVPHAT